MERLFGEVRTVPEIGEGPIRILHHAGLTEIVIVGAVGIQLGMVEIDIRGMFSLFQRAAMEVQMLADIIGAAGHILTDVLCNVVSRGYLITDRGQRTETEGPLIVRPVEKATVYELLRLRIPEGPERRSRQAIDQTVNMPSAVFVVFRHQQHLKRGVIFLPLIADELHEPLCVAIQVTDLAKIVTEQQKLLAQHDAVALAEDIDRVKVRYTALIGSGEWPDEALGEEL